MHTSAGAARGRDDDDAPGRWGCHTLQDRKL